MAVKYDWYDPDSNTEGKQIGAAGINLWPANINDSTLNPGHVNYIAGKVKTAGVLHHN